MENIELSRMDCYAGKWKARALGFTPSIHDEAGLYIEFIEGCGHSTWDLTLDEATAFAKGILETVTEVRALFGLDAITDATEICSAS